MEPNEVIKIYIEEYTAKYKNINVNGVQMVSDDVFKVQLETMYAAMSSDMLQVSHFNTVISTLFHSVQFLQTNYEHEIQSHLKDHQHEVEKVTITVSSLQERIYSLEGLIEESNNVVLPLVNAVKQNMVSLRSLKIGELRAAAWKHLQFTGSVREGSNLICAEGDEKNKLQENLEDCRDRMLDDPDETDMYPPIIQAMNDTLYSTDPAALAAHDTHKKSQFPANISVTSQSDKSLPCTVRYFVEVKTPSSGDSLKSNQHSGQMLDYFNILRAHQVYRSNFMGILTNYDAAWVYEAVYKSDREPPIINVEKARGLVDAVIHAEQTSKAQFAENRIPILDERFGKEYSVIVLQKKHTILSIPMPTNQPAAAHHMTRRGTQSNSGSWLSPRQYKFEKRFVLKASNGVSLATEIRVLKLIRNNLQKTRNIHIPELVWDNLNNDQLGIVPFGRPINFDHGETTKTCRRIVDGLMDGLWFLHGLNIIHRDIRPSNLVLVEDGHGGSVVIVDYETAVTSSSQTTYDGGYICCPRRLVDGYLEHEAKEKGASKLFEELYMPQKQDDLFAAMLVVLYLLFPSWFERYPDDKIGTDRSHTRPVQDLWNSITDSRIWGKYVRAIQQVNEERPDKGLYDTLKEMGDVFCFIVSSFSSAGE